LRGYARYCFTSFLAACWLSVIVTIHGQVWHESRNNLAKAKQLLISKEEQHKKALKERDEKTAQALEEQKADFDREVRLF
jgi:hypothetical protein